MEAALLGYLSTGAEASQVVLIVVVILQQRDLKLIKRWLWPGIYR